AEIRSLAAEIAHLSSADLSPDQYLDGFLPRLCMAMGAKAAGAWSIDSSGRPRLIGGHSLPAELIAGDRATEAHDRILRCIAAEGRPVLVPPAGVALEVDRPGNPVADSLIVVPIRVQDRVDYLLQVVQRPTGGPAAQRGYLRFVAEMADLMSDYLR